MNDSPFANAIRRGAPPAPPIIDDEPQQEPEPRKRGRPKGVKNRQPAYAEQQLGQKQIAGRFSRSTARQFRMMAAKHDTTAQALLVEALNLLFKAYGEQQIAGIAEKETDNMETEDA